MATVTLEIPEDRHEQLKLRATEEGLTVSELLLRESEHIKPWISQKELFERLKNLPRIDLGMSAADLVHEAREAHDRKILRVAQQPLTSGALPAPPVTPPTLRWSS